MEKKLYDIIGIGIGPFNLGMAALCYDIPSLQCLFIDQRSEFNWHPGLLLPDAKLQVAFYADLVTLADPCSRFSYLNFLKRKGRMFRFAISEEYYIRRTAYNDYCRWVAEQLPSLQFNCTCEAIHFDEENKRYQVIITNGDYYAKHIVIGIGSVPNIPSFADSIQNPLLFHSADYLFRKEFLLQQQRISIIGSGQSAAEIFYDLLRCYNGQLYWFTRSSRFFPMDFSMLTLEMSSPEYIDHFYSLADDARSQVLNNQDNLYKGINILLIGKIYSALNERDSDKIHLHTNCELRKISDAFSLQFYHSELQQEFTHTSDAVILATGYHKADAAFLQPVQHLMIGKTKRNYAIDSDNTLFVQNAEHTTHGFNAPDLSLGPYRNAVILNTILGYDHYEVESNTSFQTFGLPAEDLSQAGIPDASK